MSVFETLEYKLLHSFEMEEELSQYLDFPLAVLIESTGWGM